MVPQGIATPAELLEKAVVSGDLEQLSAAERLSYLRSICESLSLNILTRPFEYIKLNGKLTLYARRDATDQLRRRDGVSIELVSTQIINEVYVVTARATTREGRQDVATGAVALAGLRGDALANAMMKAETKAKRRVTLSICGLGWMDETETETVPGARVVHVDHETGEIRDPALPEPQARPEQAQGKAQPQPANRSGSGSASAKPAASTPYASTEGQRKMIFRKARQAGMSDDDLLARLQMVYNVDTRRDLTLEQAADLISYLEARIAKGPAPIDEDDSGRPFI